MNPAAHSGFQLRLSSKRTDGAPCLGGTSELASDRWTETTMFDEHCSKHELFVCNTLAAPNQ